MYANILSLINKNFIKNKRSSCFLNGARYGTLEDSNRLENYNGGEIFRRRQRTLLLTVPFKCHYSNLVLLGERLLICCLGRGNFFIYSVEINLRLSLLLASILRSNLFVFLVCICCLIVGL
jgi:hypothetical protein